MSSNTNSNRDDEFFGKTGDDDKPRAPGAFTQSFMGPGSETDAQAPPEPKTPKSPIPFTAQFGNENAFSPMPESARPSSVPERAVGDNQQPSFGGSFTKMFASESSAESATSNPPAEITRVFDRPPQRTTNSPLQQNARPSGFTEMFGSPQPSTPTAEPQTPPVAATPFESKAAGFTELFKPQPAAQATPAAQQPLSPLSAQPGTGRFTELFKGESISLEPRPVASPTPFSSPGGSGFTEFFTTPSTTTQPAATPPPLTPPPAESAPGGFTQLFKGSISSPQPSPMSPKPTGELTRMISGGGLAPQQPPSGSPGMAPSAGATRLFTGGVETPAMAPLPAGPSEYTRIVTPRQLKDLQQAAPAAGNSASPAAAGVPPLAPGITPPPAPQLATPSWQSPQIQVQQPPSAWQPPQAPPIPTAFPPVVAPAAAPKAESKILTYLPLIIGLNVLFLIAVLLILLFALKR